MTEAAALGKHPPAVHLLTACVCVCANFYTFHELYRICVMCDNNIKRRIHAVASWPQFVGKHTHRKPCRTHRKPCSAMTERPLGGEQIRFTHYSASCTLCAESPVALYVVPTVECGPNKINDYYHHNNGTILSRSRHPLITDSAPIPPTHYPDRMRDGAILGIVSFVYR